VVQFDKIGILPVFKTRTVDDFRKPYFADATTCTNGTYRRILPDEPRISSNIEI
jgi:hypothetical protein